ncbi:amino acid permease/ SLC12A domain-containing protein [Truncatella angustata]|uniref:Amino acid permease/ SLC12A domain-containing protein n=1 Tax=Truncatella angustata TaxID=152316 RepID=A0A9P8ZZS3_9PEZI|nr:amino acid permease/ SLC12A domain-containing protein [Truncatella angustata]KAH6656508.1 amino acid permease/ SLC12A domain-containing protein [Truncatella angustata]
MGKALDRNDTRGTLHSVHAGDVAGESDDQLKRHLGNRQIQLIAVGGSIGTATFVSISNGLIAGGPGSLFLAYTIYSCVMGLVNNSMAEMAVFQPVTGAFIRMAGKWVDESLGFMAGWNFFIYEALLIPFEISALNLVLSFWRDDIPVAAVVAVCILLYIAINVFAVEWYGEAEFWLSTGKILLLAIVFCFTFVTMVGGNPKHDVYGFRYWKSPGSFAEHITTGNLGRFEGFLGAMWSAAFTVVGPEYVAMVAGETKLPRRYLKNAFKTAYVRFALFFIGSALCVGIVIPYNDKTLVSILSGSSEGAGTAAASPYVIAMNNLGIGILPHITNALLVTSIFSAGNAYTYCGTRSLYGLALDGQAPKFLRKTTKAGVPIFCLAFTMVFPCLAFLNLSSSASEVLSWFINLITAAQIIDYIVICIAYIFFYRACEAQGLDRKSLPYYGAFQPYCAWIGLVFMTAVVCTYGYSVFLPGKWSIKTFFTYYTMVLVAPILYFGWKITHKTKFVKPEEADLEWVAPGITAYEAAYTEEAPGFWTEIMQIFGLRKNKVTEILSH